MVDLVFGVHGAGAGDDLVAPRQRLGTDELQQQAGDGPVVVAEDDIPVGAEYRNKMIGFIFQSFNLISFKTAVENVELPLF